MSPENKANTQIIRHIEIESELITGQGQVGGNLKSLSLE